MIFHLGFQLWVFLSLTTTFFLIFSPTFQIYSTCFLTNHSTTLVSMVNWFPLSLTFLSTTNCGFPLCQLSLHVHPSVPEAQLWEDQCEALAQWRLRHNNVISPPCCLLFLCWGSLLSVLTVALWGDSVFKLHSFLSIDNQTTYLIIFTKMIQATMYKLHQLNLSSI